MNVLMIALAVNLNNWKVSRLQKADIYITGDALTIMRGKRQSVPKGIRSCAREIRK